MTENKKPDSDVVSANELPLQDSQPETKTPQECEETEDSFPTYSSYNYPYMAPPYPSSYDGISLGMGAGVGIGGIIGMIVAIWVPTAIGESIVMFAGMAIGTVIGGSIGLVRYFMTKPTGDTDYESYDEEQGFILSK